MVGTQSFLSSAGLGLPGGVGGLGPHSRRSEGVQQCTGSASGVKAMKWKDSLRASSKRADHALANHTVVRCPSEPVDSPTPDSRSPDFLDLDNPVGVLNPPHLEEEQSPGGAFDLVTWASHACRGVVLLPFGREARQALGPRLPDAVSLRKITPTTDTPRTAS